MDVYCQHCDEPWDTYSVHHELGDDDKSNEQAKQDFLDGKGCPSCDWGEGEATDSFKSLAMGMMGDILGDDIDGMASMLDDWEYMYGLD